MTPVRLPPLDPEVLLLVGLGGALVGGLTAVAGYAGAKLAESIGKEVEVLPEIEAGQGRLLPPLPHELVAKFIQRAP